MSQLAVPNDHAPSLHGRIRGIDHITIPICDLEIAERFYVGLLGATLLMRVDEAFLLQVGGPLPPERRAELKGPNTPVHLTVAFHPEKGPRIDLFLCPSFRPPPLPHPHWAFAVAPEDLLPLRDALTAQKIPTDGPRRLGPPGQASLYFRDPFGNILEFATMAYFEPIPVGAPDISKLYHDWKG